MSHELLLALMSFAFVSTVTPGPNNLMLLSSGANFGFQRTVPHLLGITLGFAVLIVLLGLGLMQVFELYPVVQQGLRILCGVYLCWLAWKIATAAPPRSTAEAQTTAPEAQPMSFLQAALFQWVNPKAWAMAITAISVYALDRQVQTVLLVAMVFAVVGFPAITLWAVLGQQLRRWLENAIWLRRFNIAMAVLLLVSMAPLLLS